MKILILDDSHFIQDDLADYILLADRSHHIVRCLHCADVEYQLDYQKKCNEQPYDLFIVDMNAPTIGLTNEQAIESQNGWLTGWIVIRDIILPKCPDAERKIVVFSGWSKILDDYISAHGSDFEQRIYSQLKANSAILHKSAGFSALDRWLK